MIMKETSKKMTTCILALTLVTGIFQSIDANKITFAQTNAETKYV